MKKIIIVLIVITAFAGKVSAQFKDLQLHYELGSFKRGNQKIRREFFKTKFQILHKDSLGITYVNTEFDYNSDNKGATSAQYSLLRSFKVPFMKFVQPTIGHAAVVGRPSTYYAGILVPMKFGRVTLLPLLLYSYNKTAARADFRSMVGVSTRLWKKRIAIFGFASAWTFDNNFQGEIKGKKVGWQISPQIWFHVNRSLAVGTKIDYSRNLYSVDGTSDFLPTTGVRWVF